MQVKLTEEQFHAACYILERLEPPNRPRCMKIIHTRLDPSGSGVAYGATYVAGKYGDPMLVLPRGMRWAWTIKTAREAPFFHGAALEGVTWTEPRRGWVKWLYGALRGLLAGVTKNDQKA